MLFCFQSNKQDKKILQLLEENEKQLYIHNESNKDDVLRLVIGRNTARQNFEDLQRLHAETIEQLRAKANELAKKIAEHRNQSERRDQSERRNQSENRNQLEDDSQ